MINKTNKESGDNNYMEQDLFIEKIVKRKRRGIESLFSVMLVLSAILLIMIAFFIPILIQQNFFYVSAFVSFGIGYLAYRLITGLNCEYEYSITNDELNIDKIIAQRKRVNVFKGTCKDFTVMAPASNLNANSFAQKNMKHLDLRSGEDHGCDWYFITKQSNTLLMVLFEPDERFISTIRRFNQRAFFNA